MIAWPSFIAERKRVEGADCEKILVTTPAACKSEQIVGWEKKQLWKRESFHCIADTASTMYSSVPGSCCLLFWNDVIPSLWLSLLVSSCALREREVYKWVPCNPVGQCSYQRWITGILHSSMWQCCNSTEAVGQWSAGEIQLRWKSMTLPSCLFFRVRRPAGEWFGKVLWVTLNSTTESTPWGSTHLLWELTNLEIWCVQPAKSVCEVSFTVMLLLRELYYIILYQFTL